MIIHRHAAYFHRGVDHFGTYFLAPGRVLTAGKVADIGIIITPRPMNIFCIFCICGLVTPMSPPIYSKWASKRSTNTMEQQHYKNNTHSTNLTANQKAYIVQGNIPTYRGVMLILTIILNTENMYLGIIFPYSDYVSVKALLWVQYGKKHEGCGRETNTAQGDAKCCIHLKTTLYAVQ